MKKRPKCLNCLKHLAQKSDGYGWILCKSCILKQRKLQKPKQTVEMPGESIREERKKFDKDILQPYGPDGTVNKRFIKEYGKSRLSVTAQDIKEAKDVFPDTHYYKD